MLNVSRRGISCQFYEESFVPMLAINRVVEMKNVFAALCLAFVKNVKKSDKSVNRERDEHKF